MLHMPVLLAMYWAIWSEPLKAWVLGAKPGRLVELNDAHVRSAAGCVAAHGPKIVRGDVGTKS